MELVITYRACVHCTKLIYRGFSSNLSTTSFLLVLSRFACPMLSTNLNMLSRSVDPSLFSFCSVEFVVVSKWKSLSSRFCRCGRIYVLLKVRVRPRTSPRAGVRNGTHPVTRRFNRMRNYGSVSLKACMDKGAGAS